MKCRTLLAVFLCLFSVSVLPETVFPDDPEKDTLPASPAGSEEIAFPECREISFEEVPREWTEVTDEAKRIELIHQPLEALRTNLEAISTYSGTIRIEDLSLPEFPCERKMAANSSDGFIHNDRTHEIAADFKQKKVFRKVESTVLHFVCDEDAGTVSDDGGRVIGPDDGEYVPLAITMLAVETPEDFSYKNCRERLKEDTKPAAVISGVVLDTIDKLICIEPHEFLDRMENIISSDAYPERQGRRYRRGYDTMNISECYDGVEWTQFVIAADTIDGKGEEEIQEEPGPVYRIYESAGGEGGKWYCCRCVTGPGGEDDLLWNEESGFLPLYVIEIAGPNWMRIKRAQWTRSGGIYVPAEIDGITYSLKEECKMERRDRVVLTDTRINEPIDPEKFTLQALEPSDGTLIENNITDKVFEYRGGELRPVTSTGSCCRVRK
ncbi:MAG: hypothetical protein IK105_06155 [Thermoguttaceae bacterium]|nr:hypothetical protein [Thermoguttaceae bacterium]